MNLFHNPEANHGYHSHMNNGISDMRNFSHLPLGQYVSVLPPRSVHLLGTDSILHNDILDLFNYVYILRWKITKKIDSIIAML